MKTWANILLGIWLIVTGMVTLGGIRFSGSGVILGVLAVLTGILFLLVDRSEKLWPRMGNILLGDLASGHRTAAAAEHPLFRQRRCACCDSDRRGSADADTALS